MAIHDSMVFSLVSNGLGRDDVYAQMVKMARACQKKKVDACFLPSSRLAAVLQQERGKEQREKVGLATCTCTGSATRLQLPAPNREPWSPGAPKAAESPAG